MTILAFDLGGTRTRVGLFDSHLNLVQRLEMTSNAADGPDAVIGRMIALGRLLVKEQVEAIGVSAPGPLDAQSGVIHHAWTLPGWHQVPIGQRLVEAFGVHVCLENDANCGALAEYHAGAGRGCDPMIYLTISTGIGGGVIINGRLFTGWRGLAAEPGHQVFRLADGRVKTLEELASGQGIAQIAQERLRSWTDETQLRQVPMLDAKAIHFAAQQGDALAAAIIQEAGGWLGLGIVNLLHLFNPQAVVIGGSVALIGERLFEPIRAALEMHLLSPAFNAPDLLRPAALGDDVCLIGAAWVAAQRLNG
jgi:glucokinase